MLSSCQRKKKLIFFLLTTKSPAEKQVPRRLSQKLTSFKEKLAAMLTKMLAEANVANIILVHNVGITTRITEVMAVDKEMTAKVWVLCNSRT